MRQVVGFGPIPLGAGPNQVLSTASATTWARHDVVQVALFRARHTASILAAIAVALANGFMAELQISAANVSPPSSCLRRSSGVGAVSFVTVDDSRSSRSAS